VNDYNEYEFWNEDSCLLRTHLLEPGGTDEDDIFGAVLEASAEELASAGQWYWRTNREFTLQDGTVRSRSAEWWALPTVHEDFLDE